MQQNIDQASTYLSQVSYERKEDFDINKITISKYDMRKNRLQGNIDDLADNIRLRGQIEYVHIAIIENDYHLLAGYTRYFALKQLGRKTIRTILYKNLSEEEIQSIVTGTNDLRIDPSNWDRICNIADFSINNPDILIYTTKAKPEKTLCSIFGLNKSIIYAYMRVLNP
ncbi:MAG: ParB N-terminal domain-containing protein [Syntrophales bacterium]|nr:ParB N-terminal domain-containing protein [Syntrophales bacterium]